MVSNRVIVCRIDDVTLEEMDKRVRTEKYLSRSDLIRQAITAHLEVEGQ